MKPTPAQIEAAKEKIGVTAIARIIFENLHDMDGDQADWLYCKEDLETAAEQIIALTAAAQVGEPPSDYGFGKDYGAEKYGLPNPTVIRATIERCAQIAELYRDPMPDAGCCHRHKRNIAAEIRKLKNEP